MKDLQAHIARRNLLKHSVLGFLALGTPATFVSGRSQYHSSPISDPDTVFPHIEPEVAESVVGAAHGNFEKLKELVDPRPELARANWEWQFGDWESAIGAASHMGRRDIAFYLMDKGARPTLFTFAMLGAYEVVKSMIDYYPGIQTTAGAHGISLLRHARTGSRMEDQMNTVEKDNLKRLIDYLEALGDADGPSYPSLSPEEQELYVGDYKYGSGPEDGVVVSLNMRKSLSLGPIGSFGGALNKIGEHQFTFEAAPSVRVSFHLESGTVKALTINEPGRTTEAEKVS